MHRPLLADVRRKDASSVNHIWLRNPLRSISSPPLGVVHEHCNDDSIQAASITTSTLRSTPDLKGIFGANLFSGQGAGTGLKQAGKEDQVSVVAFDASPTQVEDLRQGRLDALIAQHPNDIGDKGVRIAMDYLKTNKEPARKHITTGFTIATRGNLDQPEVKEYLYKAEC